MPSENRQIYEIIKEGLDLVAFLMVTPLLVRVILEIAATANQVAREVTSQFEHLEAGLRLLRLLYRAVALVLFLDAVQQLFSLA